MRKISLRAAVSGFAMAAVALSGLAYAAGAQQSSTRQDLMNAMQGEAFATLKYLAYADAARARGNQELAALFERVAQAERQDHFAEHAKLYGLVGTDADNLRDAIKAEAQESAEMYPQMGARAEAAGDAGAARQFRVAADEEATHRDAYTLWLREVTK